MRTNVGAAVGALEGANVPKKVGNAVEDTEEKTLGANVGVVI